jgi:hypothetical protein
MVSDHPRLTCGHLDRDPFSAIPQYPLAADDLLAFAIRFRGGGYSIVVPDSRIRFVFEHGLELLPVPLRPSCARQNVLLLKVSADCDEPILPGRKHLED